jgi:hypothetical protein
MKNRTDGVAVMMEYVIITAVLMLLLVAVLAVVNTLFMQGPSDALKFHSYTDIGNGVSVRIVDLYIIAPPLIAGRDNHVVTQIDLPPDVANQWYMVNIVGAGTAQAITVGQDDNKNDAIIKVAGIGATMRVNGTATGGSNVVIRYPAGGT